MILFLLVFFLFIGVVLNHLFLWKPHNMTSFYDGNNPLWFAHRGASNAAPENTISAFNKAVKNGASGLEIDVISTLDGVLLCSHNFDLERETDCGGYIDELPYHSIKDANAALHWNSEKEGLPKLKEVLRIVPKHVRLNIEIKSRSFYDISAARDVVELVKGENFINRTIISSFNPFVIWYVKWINPQVLTGFLYNNLDYFFMINVVHPDCLHTTAELVSEGLMKFAKQRGLALNAWTVNTKPAIDWLIDLKVDGIITDQIEFYST
jgi:glycerophosphoryl diester phosphodiesterase